MAPLNCYESYDLMLLACSRAKRDDKFIVEPADGHPRRLWAVERYDGPTYRTLRWSLGWHGASTDLGNLLIYTMSGKFGLISYDTPIPWYDQKMDAKVAATLSSQILRTLVALLQDHPIRRLLYTGPAAPYGRLLQNLDRVDPHIEVEMNIARIGIQCQRLQGWLKEGNHGIYKT